MTFLITEKTMSYLIMHRQENTKIVSLLLKTQSMLSLKARGKGWVLLQLNIQTLLTPHSLFLGRSGGEVD